MNAAVSVVRSLGLKDIPVISLAEKFEEVYVEGRMTRLTYPKIQLLCIFCRGYGMKPPGLH